MTDEPRPSLWQELKERKVVRVTGVYVAVGWGVVIGGSELSQILELPTWVPKLVLALAVLGFPIALVLAWAFEVTSDGVRRATPLESSKTGRPSRLPFAAGVVVGISAISLLAFLIDGGEPVPGPDENVLDAGMVAVFPFRYSGPSDLDYLGDGVFQLLASRLTGEVGPRAADPTATASLWDAASATDPATATRVVATRLGAGLVLTGGVVAGPDGLNLTAVLRDVETDEEVAAASAQGPPDSLNAVVERLAGGILSLSVGEYQESLAQLTSADPDALREYLRGQVEVRRARWIEAYGRFVRAVEIDSTFALAALWAADGGNNVGGATTGDHLARAWRHQDRLSDRDRAYLLARLGPNYPDPSTRAERRRALEAVAGLQPERANVWYFLGEITIHFPRDTEDHALGYQYFQRAAELDPQNGNVLLHLGVAHAVRRDLDGSLGVLERRAELDGTEGTRLTAQWLRAVASRDSSLAIATVDSLLLLPSERNFIGFFDDPASLVEAWQIDPMVRLFEHVRERMIPGSAQTRQFTFFVYYAYQDFGFVERATGVMTGFERATGERYDRMRLLDAIYGGLNESVGRAAAERLDAEHTGLSDEEWTLPRVRERTALELWRIAHDDLSRIDEATGAFRRVAEGLPAANAMAVEAMALILEAMAQVRRDDPAARETLDAFDRLFLQGPVSFGVEVYDAMVLATADTYERLGDPEMALGVLVRESNFNNFRWPFGARFARERGRLAALTGDTARAIEEYEFYLVMRSQADQELQGEVAAVRAELVALRRR